MASSTSTSGDERPSGVPRDPSAAAAGAAPPQAHAEWAASLQAYYAAGGHPYAWPAAQQHMMAAAAAGVAAPYGAPVPFPMYPAYYAHASMTTGVPYPAGEPVAVAEGKSKRKGSGAPSGGSASGSARSSDGGSEESSDKRHASADQEVLHYAKRRKSNNVNVQGEPSQAATTQDAAATESRIAAKGRSAAKLSVYTPERAALSNTRPNLNIGMDLWSNSAVKAETLGQGEVDAAASSQHAGALSQMDERELKRERRKQSNRESARRSRLRKQQECEELAQKVTDLTAINGTLRSELDQLKKACEDMEAENSQLMGEMEQSEGPSVLTTLSIQIDVSKAHHGDQRHKENNNDSKG